MIFLSSLPGSGILRSARTVLLLAAVAATQTVAGGARNDPEWRHGIVVAADSLAAAIGLDVMRAGGNAVDAAVAVGFALAVTYPEAGNLGGGGYMVIHTADGKNTAIDFRETGPSAATATMFLDSAGVPEKEKSLCGPLAAGVPGSVAGLLFALEKYGTRDRRAVIDPAVRRALAGVVINGRFSASLSEMSQCLSRFPSTHRVFFRGQDPLQCGDTLFQPELASTLREIITNGADGFYAGRVAEQIVRSSAAHGGIITKQDLASYRVRERTPLLGTYRGYQIVTVPPSSGGGVTLLEILNQLERFDVRGSGCGTPRTVHLFASACQRAFADRAHYLGDPDFLTVPVEELIGKDFCLPRWKDWDSTRETPPAFVAPGSAGREGSNTTHYSVADGQGNVVSVTTTLNNLFGCGMVVDGAGFFLNDEMDDFSVKTGARNLYGLVGSTANAIAPGKRMLSSMTPTILLDRGRPFMALGARGGSKIPTAVAQIISNVIDHGLALDSAVQRPRVHTQGIPDTLETESDGVRPDLVLALEKMSYRVVFVRTVAAAQALMILGKERRLLGAPDRREGGVALGY
jgi:gamma-glutamyltranspeptidase/glutathione hydrolase